MATKQLKLLLMIVFNLVTQATKVSQPTTTPTTTTEGRQSTTKEQATTSSLSPTSTTTAEITKVGMGAGPRPLAPLNRVVYEGATNTTMMTCENSDIYLDWSIFAFAYSGSQPFRELTTNGEIVFPFNESFAINHSQAAEFYSLVVFNATISPSDRSTISTAGIYQCYNYATGSQVASQLVVIRTDPICSSNFTQSTSVMQSGDVIQLSCTIVYGAFREVYRIDAVMSWSVNGKPFPADNATFTITTSPTEITATSTIFVNKNYGANYECATTFGEPTDDPPPEVASNAPDYFKIYTISLSQPTTTRTTTTEGSQSTTKEQATTSFLSPTSTTTAEITSTTAEETIITISSSSSSSISARANGVITLAPLNRVVHEGATNTTITCESNDTFLNWFIIASAYSGSSDFNRLTTNGEIVFPFNESFAIDHPQGAEVHTLVIFNATVSPSDRATISTAGIYQCYNYASGSAVAAQLVVVRTDPICSSNFIQSTAMLQSGDAIQLSCTIVYGAFREIFPIDAVMTWSVNGQPIPANNATFTITTSQTEITATSTLVVNQNYDATYECGTTFSQPADDPPPSFANNAPDYFKTCTISHYQCLTNLRNIAVYEGQLNTVMNLAADPGHIKWSVLPSTEEMSLQTIIDFGGYMNPMFSELYDVNHTGLVIKNATTIGNPISTAGLYVGQCDNEANMTGGKLIVIHRGPECSSIPIDSTSSSVSCNVTFADGVLHPMYPIITWKRNGAYLASYTLWTERIDPYVYFATSTITSDSGSPENYECEMTFAEPTDITYPWIATNAPEFKEFCSITG